MHGVLRDVPVLVKDGPVVVGAVLVEAIGVVLVIKVDGGVIDVRIVASLVASPCPRSTSVACKGVVVHPVVDGVMAKVGVAERSKVLVVDPFAIEEVVVVSPSSIVADVWSAGIARTVRLVDRMAGIAGRRSFVVQAIGSPKMVARRIWKLEGVARTCPVCSDGTGILVSALVAGFVLAIDVREAGVRVNGRVIVFSFRSLTSTIAARLVLVVLALNGFGNTVVLGAGISWSGFCVSRTRVVFFVRVVIVGIGLSCTGVVTRPLIGFAGVGVTEVITLRSSSVV